MDDQFENKKYLSIFCTNKESSLAYSDLLVYCYRAQQDAYDNDTIPSHRRTAKATGLKEETVASATERLHQLGLLQADYFVIKPPSPRLDCFRQLDSLLEQFGDKHFTRWFQNWKCYVRQPGADNPLTVPSVMLYSLIRHSFLTNWKPAGGWSQEYLALITGTTAKTVASSIDKLQELGFIKVLDGMRFRLFNLRDYQLRFFSDKKKWSGKASSEPDEMVSDFSPASKEVELEDNCRSELALLVSEFKIAHHLKGQIYQGIVCQKDWYKQDWRDLANNAAKAAKAASEAGPTGSTA